MKITRDNINVDRTKWSKALTTDNEKRSYLHKALRELVKADGDNIDQEENMNKKLSLT